MSELILPSSAVRVCRLGIGRVSATLVICAMVGQFWHDGHQRYEIPGMVIGRVKIDGRIRLSGPLTACLNIFSNKTTIQRLGHIDGQ